MKRRFFAIASGTTLAFHALSAQAVALNPRGEGQALVFPYYTVNKGLDTLIAFDNDSPIGKLVNVRFLEGYNGRTVLDFNVWLGPHDGWLGSISSGGNADTAARLFSSDRSCSNVSLSPALAFSTAAFNGTSESSPADGGPTDASRTREGHFEVIAIGDIPAGSDTEAAVREFRCTDIRPNAELDAPKPTLFGSGTIIDVGNGYFYGYNADALTGFTDKVLTRDAHGPTLADANSAGSANANGAIATVFDDAGNALTVDYARGVDAVTAVYMSGSITNDYNLMPGLGANTDWVITFPTKRFYFDKQLFPSEITMPFNLPGDGDVIADSRIAIDYDGAGITAICNGGDQACWRMLHQQFAYETNVVAFERQFLDPSTDRPDSEVLGSRLLTPWPVYPITSTSEHPGIFAGWLHLDFNQPFNLGEQTLASGQRAQVSLTGIPTTGFMVYNVVNANASNGKLANYGGAFAHRMSAPTCEGSGGGCSAQ